MPNPNREKVSGLWVNEYTDKEGKTIRYMSGQNDGVKYSIWPNSYKETDSQPTHILYKESSESGAPSVEKSDLPF